MKTMIITTDAVFEPWHIPVQGQEMIARYYASTNNIEIDGVITAPTFTHTAVEVYNTLKSTRSRQLLLCSIFQLPVSLKDIKTLVNLLSHYSLHFCLDNLAGTGSSFIMQCIKDAKKQHKQPTLDYTQTSNKQAIKRYLEELL